MKPLSKITLLMLGVIGGYSASAAPLNRMVANWHIDEGRGQKILDSSGYGKSGRLGSSAGIDATDPLWVSRRFDNTALSFDGSKFIKVTHARHLEPQKISVEAWVKPGATDETSLPYIVAKGAHDCNVAAYGLYIHKDASGNLGVPFFYVSDSNVSYTESPDGAPSLLDGQWHHLVGTYDRTAVRLYVDGVQVGAGTPSTAPIPYALFEQKDLYIGDYDGDTGICTDYNHSYIGEIDEIRIWNKALTATEVASRYQGY